MNSPLLCRMSLLAFALGITVLATLAFAASLKAQQLTPSPPAPAHDLYADTWVATDALGRSLPTFAETGPPRAHKTVGMFYFLTSEHGGAGPYDNTKILSAHPEAIGDIHNPAWGPLNRSHYWGEPLMGYYASDDDYVLRKHAHMLAAAGVDVVIFDNSNAVTYDRARNRLCRVWEQIRREGGQTPQIAFLCPFGNPGRIGSNTVREIYDTLYKTGQYSDLWFQWNGKPLIFADASYANAINSKLPSGRIPTPLPQEGTLGQTFTADRPFLAVGGEFPTWASTGSGMTLSLYDSGPGGRLMTRTQFPNVLDNATIFLEAQHALPAGKYYLEMSRSVGQIGWWGYSGNVYDGGEAFEAGNMMAFDRSLTVQFVGASQPQMLSPSPHLPAAPNADTEAQEIGSFFTFRTPIAPYNLVSPPRNHWAWLQIFPQAPQRDDAGTVEEVAVGVAQNYNATVNSTAPMSVTGAFGRSYHAGKLDTRPDAVNWGYNFAEQWQHALEIDPPFVFVTGWNEWTAGFYDNWAGFHAPPAIFVDQFTQEFSRDIEPMRGGHGDNYYYQLANFTRRYKGTRPLPLVSPAPVKMDGTFAAWQKVTPEFRDAIGDPAHRRSTGVGSSGTYVNATGRNDIVAAKVSYDAKNIFFYVRTHDTLTPHTDKDWMLLYVNIDGNYQTGWMGYDFVLNRHAGNTTTTLEKNVGGAYQWKPVGQVQYQAGSKELVIAVPRTLLGIKTLPQAIDFKWADNCYAKGDWTDFTLNGDAAPDDRFNYRAAFSAR